MKKIMVILLLASLSGCSFYRHTTVSVKPKNLSYGPYSVSGDLIYEAVTYVGIGKPVPTILN